MLAVFDIPKFHPISTVVHCIFLANSAGDELDQAMIRLIEHFDNFVFGSYRSIVPLVSGSIFVVSEDVFSPRQVRLGVIDPTGRKSYDDIKTWVTDWIEENSLSDGPLFFAEDNVVNQNFLSDTWDGTMSC